MSSLLLSLSPIFVRLCLFLCASQSTPTCGKRIKAEGGAPVSRYWALHGPPLPQRKRSKGLRPRGSVVGAFVAGLGALMVFVRCRTVPYGAVRCLARVSVRVSYGARTESSPYATYGAPRSGLLPPSLLALLPTSTSTHSTGFWGGGLWRCVLYIFI
jgi:hypothetical protein